MLFGLFGEFQDLKLFLDTGDVVLRQLIREGVAQPFRNRE